MGIQLLQWGPATASWWIPIEEWEGHSSLQVPGRFGLVLICSLSNDEIVDCSSQIFSQGRVLFARPTKQKNKMLPLAPEGSGLLLRFFGYVHFICLAYCSTLNRYRVRCLLLMLVLLVVQVVVVQPTTLFLSLSSFVVLTASCSWSSCSEVAVRRLNTSVPAGGNRDATLEFCSAARTPSSPCSRFLATQLTKHFSHKPR